MRVLVTIEREYEMDEAKVLGTADFDPPAPDAPADEKRKWLSESFYELCPFGRDSDHIDGTYVRLVDENQDAEFSWPKGLRR